MVISHEIRPEWHLSGTYIYCHQYLGLWCSLASIDSQDPSSIFQHSKSSRFCQRSLWFAVRAACDKWHLKGRLSTRALFSDLWIQVFVKAQSDGACQWHAGYPVSACWKIQTQMQLRLYLYDVGARYWNVVGEYERFIVGAGKWRLSGYSHASRIFPRECQPRVLTRNSQIISQRHRGAPRLSLPILEKQ
jgi:hypothetical protein